MDKLLVVWLFCFGDGDSHRRAIGASTDLALVLWCSAGSQNLLPGVNCRLGHLPKPKPPPGPHTKGRWATAAIPREAATVTPFEVVHPEEIEVAA